MSLPVIATDMWTARERLAVLGKRLSTKSPNNRIEFAATAYKYRLSERINRHEFHDQGITSRDLDACGEMGDYETVIHGVIKLSFDHPEIKEEIESMGEKVWASWYTMYENVEGIQPPLI